MRALLLGAAFGLALLAPGPAAAQDEPATSAEPESPCTKPVLAERMSVPKEDLAALFERGQSYTDCMSKAIEAKRERANSLMEQARAEAAASNALVEEVNAFVAALRAYEAEHRDDE